MSKSCFFVDRIALAYAFNNNMYAVHIQFIARREWHYSCSLSESRSRAKACDALNGEIHGVAVWRIAQRCSAAPIPKRLPTLERSFWQSAAPDVCSISMSLYEKNSTKPHQSHSLTHKYGAHKYMFTSPRGSAGGKSPIMLSALKAVKPLRPSSSVGGTALSFL